MRLAVIPARGGSKRIPLKNIRPFCGKPIIAYSIEAAAQSAVFDRIIVSTDSEEIASVARQYGAEVPFMRPATIANDHTGTNAVARHAVEWLQERGERIEHACCIYATAPMIEARYIRQGYDELLWSGAAFAFSVTSFPAPIQRALRLDVNHRVGAFYPQHEKTRSQDLEPAYHDAGQFYWGTTQAFLSGMSLFSEASIGIVLPRYVVEDIDCVEDWERAELMFLARRGRSGEPGPAG